MLASARAAHAVSHARPLGRKDAISPPHSKAFPDNLLFDDLDEAAVGAMASKNEEYRLVESRSEGPCTGAMFALPLSPTFRQAALRAIDIRLATFGLRRTGSVRRPASPAAPAFRHRVRANAAHPLAAYAGSGHLEGVGDALYLRQ